MHLRKERFPTQRKSKLILGGDGLFQVLERINDNAYKIDLPGEYGVSATFNVVDLSAFDFDVDADSRTNHFEEGGNDATKLLSKPIKLNDPLHYERPITRSKIKKFKQSLNSFVLCIMSKIVDLTFSANMELNNTVKFLKRELSHTSPYHK